MIRDERRHRSNEALEAGDEAIRLAPIAANARALGQFMGMVIREHNGKVDPVLVRKIDGEVGLK